MVKTTIDGIEAEIPAGTSILEAAKTVGMEIPHLCYHPKLSLSGNCRMCLVEIEGVPKLQISCGTPVKDGMVVYTMSDRVKKARKAILEFQLINHPVDCPVCDQAGECKLQDYYMDHSLEASRLSVEKVARPRLVHFGADVVHNDERCVTCLRCVRFLREITKTGELCAVGRGDHTEIDIFPGSPVENRYSGCVTDVCPVGAMTSKDFRFKKRVWYLTKTESICPGCERGCNITVEYEYGRTFYFDPRPGRVFRLKPRRNDDVNETWICDHGRLIFHDFEDAERPGAPLVRQGGRLVETSWDNALATAAENLKAAGSELAMLVSPGLTNEELFLAKKLAGLLGTENMAFDVKQTGEWAAFEDDILIKKDKSPNSKGAELLGCGPRDGGAKFGEILADVKSGKAGHLLVIGLDPLRGADGGLKEAFGNLSTLITIDWHKSATAGAAQIFLPGATWYEKSGTYTNFARRVQRTGRCFPPPPRARPEWKILSGLVLKLGHTKEYDSARAVLVDMGEEVKAFQGVTWEDIGPLGIMS